MLLCIKRVVRYIFRHHLTYFYVMFVFRLITKAPNGQYINPPSGTVADDVVTCPERYDFFLVCLAQTIKRILSF